MSYTFIVPKIGCKSNSKFHLIFTRGSILDFSHPRGAIVNAANEGCLGGGGVDGAISKAGGEILHLDRVALPIISQKELQKKNKPSTKEDDHQKEEDHDSDSSSSSSSTYYEPIRCKTGDAKMTGPNSYGSIGCPYVIHAVGPAYFQYEHLSPNNKLQEPDQLLQSAYTRSLERARESKLEAVAFPLLSAGVFRGTRSRKTVLRIGVDSICGFDFGSYSELREVHIFAFSPVEMKVLLGIAKDLGLLVQDVS